MLHERPAHRETANKLNPSTGGGVVSSLSIFLRLSQEFEKIRLRLQQHTLIQILWQLFELPGSLGLVERGNVCAREEYSGPSVSAKL